MSMASVIYTLCAITSLFCVLLLLRSYVRTRSRLLLWSLLCFVGIGLSNVLLVVELFLVPTWELMMPRLWLALIGVVLLVFGLIWESE
jgi:hypothetical protein